MMLALHLQDTDYSKALRRELKDELVDAVIGILWRLSTELLKAQLYVKHGALADAHHPLAAAGTGASGSGGGGSGARHGRTSEHYRLQLIAHAQETVGGATAKRPVRFSLHGTDTMSKRYMKWFKGMQLKRRAAGSAGKRTAAVLPAGWESDVDTASGRTYYCNAARGVTQWEIPTA